jgi:4-azaleucine resistance transporter AzlC
MNSSEPSLAAIPTPDRKSAASAEFRRGLIDSVPILLGFTPFALVLGARATQSGLTRLEVPLLTGLNFGGGSEFAAIQLWTSPPHLLLIVMITFLVNSRHILMGAALTPWIEHLPRRTALALLFVMCDESWALGMADVRRRIAADQRPHFSVPYYLGTASSFYFSWLVFTTLGGLIGPLMGNVQAYGFDLAFPAVFLVLMRGMWKGWRPARPWLISLLVAGASHRLFPGAWHVLAGALAGLLAAYCWAPVDE